MVAGPAASPGPATIGAMTDANPSRRRNPVGLASLIAGVLLLLCGVASAGVAVALPQIAESLGTSFQAVSLLIRIPSALLALVALVLGIVGLALRDRPRAAAIVGTTLGASHLVAAGGGTLVSFLVAAVLF